jgi:hypothetical protein
LITYILLYQHVTWNINELILQNDPDLKLTNEASKFEVKSLCEYICLIFIGLDCNKLIVLGLLSVFHILKSYWKQKIHKLSELQTTNDIIWDCLT